MAFRHIEIATDAALNRVCENRFMTSKATFPAARERSDFAELSSGIVTGLGFTFVLIAVLVVPLTNNLLGTRDFVEYWAAGQLLVHHANPYDPGATLAIERTVNGPDAALILMLNPPWTLPLVCPLGFLGLRTAALLWNLLLLISVLVSLQIARRLHGSPPNRLHWLGLAFTPVILALAMGQLSVLVMLGYMLFLRFHRDRPLVSGAALWLCTLKPHLFLPVAVVMVAWVLVSRTYKVLMSAAIALSASVIAAFVIDPHAWREYMQIMRAPALEGQFIPCLADAFRHWLDPHAGWLRFLPAAVCCLWALSYYWRRRSVWAWTEHGNLLILVSLVVAPYGWFYDQCCALPAILHGSYTVRSRSYLTALALMILLADIQLYGIKSVSPLGSPLWLWTGPAWFAWYLAARVPRSFKVAGSAQMPA